MRTPKWALRAVHVRQGVAKLPCSGSPSSRMRRAVSLACLRALRASPLVMGLRAARLLRVASTAVMCREMRMVSAQRPVKRSRWALVRASRKSWTRGCRAGGSSLRAAVPVRVAPRTERAAAMVGSMPSRRWRRAGAWGVSVLLQPILGSPEVLVCGSVCVASMIVIPLPSIPPKDTDCQIVWRVRKLGRCDTPGSGRCVTAG